jgi:hypothetical protein
MVKTEIVNVRCPKYALTVNLICAVIIMLAMRMNGTVEGNFDSLYCRFGRMCYPDIL